jgi:branched-chain amino acid transport system substrate-binding protein
VFICVMYERKTNMKTIVTLVTLVALSLSALGGALAQDETPRIGAWEACPTPSALPAEVKLGMNIGLTGATSLYGIPQQQGIQLALAEINATGYLGESELVGLYEDGASSAETAIAAMEKLLFEDKVVAVIGPTFSAQAFAADPIAQEAGIPVLGITNLAAGITDIGDYIFRNGLLDSVQIPAAVNAVVDLRQPQTAALIYDDRNEFTVTGYEIFKETLKARGVEIVAEETFRTGEVVFDSQLTNIIGAEPDVLMVSALGAEAIPLLTQARTLGYEGPIVGGNGFNAPALLTEAGADAQGVIIGAAWHISNDNPLNLAFVEAFEAEFGFLPDQFAAQAYTAAWLMATAIRCADSVDGAAIRDALAAIRDFDSPLGLFSFDENRDPVHEPVVQIILDGRFEVLTAETLAQAYGE